MTAAKYRAALAQLGMNPTAAAGLLGVSAPTSRRYTQQGIRGAPEILLKLLLTGGSHGMTSRTQSFTDPDWADEVLEIR
jgi:hypothetical protein